MTVYPVPGDSSPGEGGRSGGSRRTKSDRRKPFPRKLESDRLDHAALLRRIVDFVTMSRTDLPFPELLAEYRALVQPLGFSHVTLMDISQVQPDPNSGLRLTTFSDELIARISETSIDLGDPVWRAAVVSDRACLWSDVVRKAGRDVTDPTLFYRMVGLEDGLTIPLHARDVWRTVEARQ